MKICRGGGGEKKKAATTKPTHLRSPKSAVIIKYGLITIMMMTIGKLKSLLR